MIRVIILGHKGLAENLVACAEKILGPLAGVYSLDVKEADTQAIFGRELETFIGLPGEKLLLVDSCNGIKYDVCQQYADHQDVKVISGVNVPMVLSVLEERSKNLALEELALSAVRLGQQGIQII